MTLTMHHPDATAAPLEWASEWTIRFLSAFTPQLVRGAPTTIIRRSTGTVTNVSTVLSQVIEVPPALGDFISDLFELLREETDDEDSVSKPTFHAFATTWDLVKEISVRLWERFPYGIASNDSEGGIRIEWHRGDCEVRLVIPSQPSKRSYIYFEADGNGKIEPVSASAIVRRLEWLLEQ